MHKRNSCKTCSDRSMSLPRKKKKMANSNSNPSIDTPRESDPIRGDSAPSRAGFNAVAVNSMFYAGTIVSFLVASLVPGLPKLPFPVIGCMVTANSGSFGHWQPGAQTILMVLYAGHFVRRTAEVLFVHRYKRRMPVGETLGAPVYYWTFGFWAGWAIRPDLGYVNTNIALFIIGAVIFLLGEIGNCAAHVQLRMLRSGSSTQKKEGQVQAPPSGHVIPRGALFALVSCPHYTSEIITWLGFFLATWTLNGALFLVATIITLIFYSSKHHKRYKAEFDGRDGRELYPTRRKALIPFIF